MVHAQIVFYLFKAKMRQLEPNKGIPRHILLMMAVLAGFTVANLYYNQALLELISQGAITDGRESVS